MRTLPIALTVIVPLGCRGDQPVASTSESTGSSDSSLSGDLSTSSSSTTDAVDESSSGGTTGAGPNDDVAMVHVPAGPFGMGCNPEVDELCSEYQNQLPAHEVMVAGFSIDTVEVTQSRYAACIDAGACTAPDPVHCSCIREPYGDEQCLTAVFTPDATPDVPVTCVGPEMARAYCDWTEKRLPTEAEWEKAARSDDGRRYPWGNEGTSCNRVVRQLCGAEGSQPVGSVPEGASPFGVLDMAGNVWEWVADRYHPYYYTESPANDPAGDSSAHHTVFRGGGWFEGFEAAVLMYGTSYRGYASSWAYDVLGFRCVSPDDPAVCGNRILEPGEICDDGNDVDGDGCSSACEHSGRAIWAEYLYGAQIQDSVIALAVGTGGGAAWLAGSAAGANGDRDIWLAGTRNVGQLFSPPNLLRPTISGDTNGDDAATGIVVDPSGATVWVVGYVTTSADDTDVLVRAYDVSEVDADTSASPIWEWTHDGGMGLPDAAHAVVIDADGTLVVAGETRGQGTLPDAWVARVDTSAAPADALVWESSWDNPDVGEYDTANGVAVGPDGTIAVTGFTQAANHRQIWTARYDDGGTQVWHAIYDSPQSLAGLTGMEVGNGVAFDAEGNVVVTGRVLQAPRREGGCSTNGIYTCTNGVVLWYSPDGELVEEVFHAADANGDEGVAVVAHTDGRIYVAVLEAQSTGVLREAAVLAFSGPGELAWTSRPLPETQPVALVEGDAGALLLGASDRDPYDGQAGVVALLQP